MSFLNIVDFRDEFYVKAIRRWVVIDTMRGDRKFSDGVSLQKAAFVDFLLCNPGVMQRFLVNFGKAQLELNLDEFLYKDNIEYGSAQDASDFSKTCVFLISKRYLSFGKNEGGILFFPGELHFSLEANSIKVWRSQIGALLPLMGKSANVLHNSILGESNNVPHNRTIGVSNGH